MSSSSSSSLSQNMQGASRADSAAGNSGVSPEAVRLLAARVDALHTIVESIAPRLESLEAQVADLNRVVAPLIVEQLRLDNVLVSMANQVGTLWSERLEQQRRDATGVQDLLSLGLPVGPIGLAPSMAPNGRVHAPRPPADSPPGVDDEEPEHPAKRRRVQT